MKLYLHLGAAALLALSLLYLPAISTAARQAARAARLWGGVGLALLRSEAGEVNTGAVSALKEKRNGLVAKMRELLDTAEGEDRDLTEAEQTQYDGWEAERAALATRIERGERLEAEERSLGTSTGVVAGRADTRGQPGHTEHKEFRNAGEFMYAVRFNPGDPRLQYVEELEGRELAMGTDTAGGFMVPDEIKSTLLQVEPQDAIVEPRATFIPAGDQPDATVKFPALDQNGAGQNMYGGVVVEWIGEGDEKQETNAKLREIAITPEEVAGRIVITDKLLRNWRSANPLIEKLLRGALNAAKDAAFIGANGVGKPLGILASPATLLIPREVADQISYADVVAIYGNMKLGGKGMAWITTQRVLPQLMQMTDDAGQLIWQPNGRDGAPGTLLGIDVLINERSPALGDPGDLLLANLPYYLVKEGTGPVIAASPHVLFNDNKTVVKAFLTVGGKPWLTGPIKLENGDEVSPFVALDIPEV